MSNCNAVLIGTSAMCASLRETPIAVPKGVPPLETCQAAQSTPLIAVSSELVALPESSWTDHSAGAFQGARRARDQEAPGLPLPAEQNGCPRCRAAVAGGARV
jgi:hypothetical protein